jgi:hypothetical protein
MDVRAAESELEADTAGAIAKVAGSMVGDHRGRASGMLALATLLPGCEPCNLSPGGLLLIGNLIPAIAVIAFAQIARARAGAGSGRAYPPGGAFSLIAPCRP